MITNFLCNFETTDNKTYIAKAGHGESLRFTCEFTNEGVPIDALSDYTASILYQNTKVLSSNEYYQISADNETSAITFDWEHANDFGDNTYRLFLRLDKDGEVSYPGLIKLQLENTPGFIPAVDPGPVIHEYITKEAFNAHVQEANARFEALENGLSAYLLSADADRDFTKKTIFDAHVLSADEKMTQLESKFEDYALSDDVESNFTKKTIFDDHVTSADEKLNQLESKFDDYALSDDVKNNFASKSIFNAHVLSADTKLNQLESKFDDYATSADLSAKYDKTGGTISGDVDITGKLNVKGKSYLRDNVKIFGSFDCECALSNFYIERQSVQDLLDDIDETYAKKTNLDNTYAKLNNPTQEITTRDLNAKKINILDSNGHVDWAIEKEGFSEWEGESKIYHRLPLHGGRLLDGGRWINLTNDAPVDATWDAYYIKATEQWQRIPNKLTRQTRIDFTSPWNGSEFIETHIVFSSDTAVEVNFNRYINWQNGEVPEIVNRPATYELIITEIGGEFYGGIVRYE